MPAARFRISGIASDVTFQELQKALESDLCLEGVALVPNSLRPAASADSGDAATQEAELELPHDEADLLRGPMKEAKIRLRSTMLLRFDETAARTEPRASRRRSNDYEPLPRGSVKSARQPGQAIAPLRIPDVTSNELDDQRYSVGPEMAYCSRWLDPSPPQGQERAPEEQQLSQAKSYRACNGVVEACSLQ
eukprot:TRINITY_DN29939_c0_g1_i1.p1 TRINITY_DN29939_c0_g1~~TRINITY_DN29939_c0_g1_i1.p1  ORF type:complete len:192 (+),score=48.32 TRINITY_DN29939_c0_g1_i1:146-721(+)